MARPAGLEPATIRLEGGCSIQLSYGRFYLHSFGAQTSSYGDEKTLQSRLTQQQAVLDKRGACYRDRMGSSTPYLKKFQLDKGVTGAVRYPAFAASPRRARMPLLFKSFPMVNQAS